MAVADFQNKFYRKKTRPSDLSKHADDIYDENLTLKNKLNQLEHNVLV